MVTTARSALQKRLDRATASLEAPLAVVDLDAFDDNTAALTARAAGKPIRVASKSVRCRALLSRVLARPGMSEAAFEAIRSKQMPDAEKRARADYVIDTSRGFAAAEAAVDRIIAAVTRG